jgi:heme/copper-type cytochrome/quinol oxidase subunit 2
MSETLIIIFQILAFITFITLIFYAVKNENWKEKFFENKQARSILIVFTLILVLTTLMGIYMDVMFPVEVLR